jgi:hypothetical protein
METIHSAIKLRAGFGGIPTSYIKKITKDVDAELQQGVFNDVNEIGTSKSKRKRSKIEKRLKALEERNPGVFERRLSKKQSK